MQNELLSCAIRAALLAGKDILNIYDDPKADFAIERKADNSPLTIADKRSHARIMDELDATSIPVLSEEGRLTDYDKRKGWKTLWVVDPLDGTKEFIKRNGEFTVNIALVENGIPVLGVIYVPVSRTLYFYPRFAPTMEWDTAAGHAIVRASGKNIYLTDERTPLHYNKENLLNPWFIVK